MNIKNASEDNDHIPLWDIIPYFGNQSKTCAPLATWKKYTLNFKRPSGTSRGVLTAKDSYIIGLSKNGLTGIGECSLIKGLSPDPTDRMEDVLDSVCQASGEGRDFHEVDLGEFPSIRFGLEMALRDLEVGDHRLFDTPFSRGDSGIPVNGLVWMGDKAFMKAQIKTKISDGFRCIKIKIGAIDFDEEIDLLKYIRSQFNADDIEIRVDANGAFTPEEAMDKLERLSVFDLHSIEQPIRQGQIDEMARLCAKSPLPIALDEELIGVHGNAKAVLIDAIKPQYIILKPSLLGGWKASAEWIDIAKQWGIGWWVTSALESNIGLNAIAQWTATLDTTMYQGLGTGQLFTNNIPSPLNIRDGKLFYSGKWNLSFIDYNGTRYR